MTDAEGVSLREHLEMQISALGNRVKEMEAVRLRELATARESIERGQALYITRDMHDALIQSVNARLEVLERSKSNLEGRLWMLTTGLTTAVILINLVFHFWTPK